MAVFAPVNMMGPAHRQASIQQASQAAAQNVMRRQRMKALIGRGAAGVNSTGQQQMLRGSMAARPSGVHPASMLLPGGGMGTLAQQLALSSASATLPNGANGMNPNGSGSDFGAVADPNDGQQAPVSVTPGTPGAVPQWPGTPNGGGSLFVGQPPNVATGGPNGGGSLFVGNDGNSGGPPAGGGSIPLGGGLFYDPATDQVHGAGGPITKGAQA